jgi:hypothetical protein
MKFPRLSSRKKIQKILAMWLFPNQNSAAPAALLSVSTQKPLFRSALARCIPSPSAAAAPLTTSHSPPLATTPRDIGTRHQHPNNKMLPRAICVSGWSRFRPFRASPAEPTNLGSEMRIPGPAPKISGLNFSSDSSRSLQIVPSSRSQRRQVLPAAQPCQRR